MNEGAGLGGARPLLVCMQCGFTHAEFRARGLLGCPACYDHFGDVLFADLLHIHPDLYRRPAADFQPLQTLSSGGEDAAALRERLTDALRQERYEDAAELRRRLHSGPDAQSNTSPREGAPP
jgi:protein arginine kinase activator